MPDTKNTRPDLAWIESEVCAVAAEQLGLSRHAVTPRSRVIEDLHCDSLGLVELFMELEERFQVTLPSRPDDPSDHPSLKAVFTRAETTIADLAEAVYLQWNTGSPPKRRRFSKPAPIPLPVHVPFTQLGGELLPGQWRSGPLFESLGHNDSGCAMYRRRTDGMRCVQIPAVRVRIGYDGPEAMNDEKPVHDVELSSFMIDAEPVSATAYARFLNSVTTNLQAPLPHWAGEVLVHWILLDPSDRRREHSVIQQVDGRWRPVAGVEHFPMVLVSWYGAHAYALWANRQDWRDFGDGREVDFLPSEAQWEYAARGSESSRYPWGNGDPTDALLCAGRHRRGQSYTVSTMPMAAVNDRLGMSPFGLHHMAGNVWQWCRDWYDPAFYKSTDAILHDATARRATAVRSERGGSWVGPASLARSSFRRARSPHAMGRCLGFRCVSRVPE